MVWHFSNIVFAFFFFFFFHFQVSLKIKISIAWGSRQTGTNEKKGKMSRFRHMALKGTSHPLPPFHPLDFPGSRILSFEQTIPMVCWARGGFGFFLATLPETFSSAGKTVGVLLWHFLGCLPGRLCSISHPARGEGEELAAGMGQGEEGWGVRRRRRRVCHQPSSLPQSKGFHENLSLRLECQRKRHRRRNLFWFSSKEPETRSEVLVQRKKTFLPGTILHETSFPLLQPKPITPMPSLLPTLFPALFPHLPFIF